MRRAEGNLKTGAAAGGCGGDVGARRWPAAARQPVNWGILGGFPREGLA